MKLKIEHLAPYLPYGLKVKWGADIADLIGLIRDAVVLNGEFWMSSQKTSIENIKPILRPLSDLTKEIEVNGEKFFPIKQLDAYHNFSMMHYSDIVKDPTRYPYTIVQRLLELHFDVFGLIPNNLAIDLNSLNK